MTDNHLLTIETLCAKIATGEIDTVITAACDMQGRLIGKRVTGEHFATTVMHSGSHFCTYLLATDMDLGTPDGFESQNWASGYGDYLARLDNSTIRILPWLEKTALIFADVVDDETGALVEVAPRSILRHQLDRLSARGISAKMATELEYYLFEDSYQEAHRKGYDHLQVAGWYSEDYQLFQSTKNEALYRQLRQMMQQAGVPVEFSKGEAAAGQHEINIHFTEALAAADRALLFKHGAKEMAWQRGQAITFMAKPDESWTGSSGHIHISLWQDATDDPLFYQDPDLPAEMSDVMRWFLGGLVASARDLSLLVASNINSYKRYAAASWAPVNAVWARDNRTCGFRIVGDGPGLRIENRLPGSDSNPYLAFAAVIAAGLYGIEHEIEPPPAFNGNAYLATDVPRVPVSLLEAMMLWQNSDIARESFGEKVVTHYANAARVEVEAFGRSVTDWERYRYFERG